MVEVGLAVTGKPPRVKDAEVAVGVVKGDPLVPVAEPVKLNGLVVPVLFIV